jgi:hypothetical protein
MNIDANKLFVATVSIVAMVWIFCAALVILLPSGMMTMTGHMIHGNLQGMAWSMNATGFFVGLIIWSALAGVIVWLIAILYNKLIT